MNQLRTLHRPWLFAAILCVFTSACSTTFLYRHMDWLLIRFVEGYVELDEPQKQHIRADLARVSAALEQSVLPDLKALLERLAEDNQRGLLAANLEQYMQQLESLYKRTARLVEPGLSVLALNLDSEQKSQLFQEFARRDQKFQRKYIAKGEEYARQEHQKTLQKNIRKWLGKIGAEQEAALQDYDDLYRANEQAWLDSKQRWRAELRRVLDSDDGDAKNTRLTQLLLQPQDFWTRKYRALADQNRSASITLTRRLAVHMNASQRDKFAQRLGKNQKKVANFAQAIATTAAQEIAAPQSSLRVAAAILPPTDLPRRADSQ